MTANHPSLSMSTLARRIYSVVSNPNTLYFRAQVKGQRGLYATRNGTQSSAVISGSTKTSSSRKIETTAY